MGASGFTTDDVVDLIYQVMPRGFARWMGGWIKSDDVYLYFAAIADTLVSNVYDLLASLRAEFFPLTATQKLPDFERALGLENTRIALFGTIAQRRAAIISKFRESGAFTNSNVRSILGPLLGYVDPSALRIIETSRSAMKAAHLAINAAPVTIPNNGTATSTLAVRDGGPVSSAGAQLIVRLTHSNVEHLVVELFAPDGTSVTWTLPGSGSVTNQDYLLYDVQQAISSFSHRFAGAQMTPNDYHWTLTVSDLVGGSSGTLVLWSLFVEGAGKNGLGGSLVDWGVFADPTLTGIASPADLEAAQIAISRIKHAHTKGHVLTSIAGAHPDTTTGAHAAIPDMFLPA